VITTYNRRELLPYAIQSVLDQTYTNYEIIVVNDCGEDVWDVIESFNSDKIIYLSHIKNSGLPFARNTAIRVSQGEILCYLDDDDLFLPSHLETIVHEFQNDDIGLVFTDSYYVEEELIEEKRIEINRAKPYEDINFSMERLLVSNFIPVNAWTHRSFLIEKVGYFDESLSSLEDWDMLIRLAQNCNVSHINKTTVEVRYRKNIGDNMLFREKGTFYHAHKHIYKQYPVSKLKILEERKFILCYLAIKEYKLMELFKEVFMNPLKLISFIVFAIKKTRNKFVSK